MRSPQYSLAWVYIYKFTRRHIQSDGNRARIRVFVLLIVWMIFCRHCSEIRILYYEKNRSEQLGNKKKTPTIVQAMA